MNWKVSQGGIRALYSTMISGIGKNGEGLSGATKHVARIRATSEQTFNIEKRSHIWLLRLLFVTFCYIWSLFAVIGFWYRAKKLRHYSKITLLYFYFLFDLYCLTFTNTYKLFCNCPLWVFFSTECRLPKHAGSLWVYGGRGGGSNCRSFCPG